MAVVDHYDRFRKFNPGALAESIAKKQLESEEAQNGGSSGAAGAGAAADGAVETSELSGVEADSGSSGANKRKLEPEATLTGGEEAKGDGVAGPEGGEGDERESKTAKVSE